MSRVALFSLASVLIAAPASSASIAQQQNSDPLSYIESGDEIQVGPGVVSG